MKIRNKITNTEPCAFHLNGGSGHNTTGFSVWNAFKANYNNIEKEKLREDTALGFFMCGYKQKTMIEESAEFFGVDVNNIYSDELDLPQKKARSAFTRKYQLLRSKPFAMEKFLLNNPSLRYIIGCDASDVFLAKHPNRIVEIFEKDFDCKMLFNAEINLYPTCPETSSIYDNLFSRSDYNVSKSKFCYLNSGLFIADTKYYLEVMNEYRELKYIASDDQGQFQLLFGKKYGDIQIDFDCKIFQSMYKVDVDIELIN